MVGFNHRLGDQQDLEISFRGQTPTMSRANPGMCLQCHGGTNARPNTIRLGAGLLERNLPSLAHSPTFGGGSYWRDFLLNAKDDEIYSKLQLPCQ